MFYTFWLHRIDHDPFYFQRDILKRFSVFAHDNLINRSSLNISAKKPLFKDLWTQTFLTSKWLFSFDGFSKHIITFFALLLTHFLTYILAVYWNAIAICLSPFNRFNGVFSYYARHKTSWMRVTSWKDIVYYALSNVKEKLQSIRECSGDVSCK